MAVIKFTNSKGQIAKIIRYVSQTEKTDAKLLSGKDCMAESALEEMKLVKQMFGKEHGRQYIHMVQSFSPDEKLDYKTAHKVALETAKYFEGFQVLVATHKDRDHIHSHFVINSVNFETGLKFQQSRNDLMEKVRPFSDAVCRKYGLSVIETKEKQVSSYIDQATYKVAEKGESWKFQLINAIERAMESRASKQDFIAEMELHGYQVKWNEKRKHITYTMPDGKKCRSNKLYEDKFTKENMEVYFERKIEAGKRGQSTNATNAGEQNDGRRSNRETGCELPVQSGYAELEDESGKEQSAFDRYHNRDFMLDTSAEENQRRYPNFTTDSSGESAGKRECDNRSTAAAGQNTIDPEDDGQEYDTAGVPESVSHGCGNSDADWVGCLDSAENDELEDSDEWER